MDPNLKVYRLSTSDFLGQAIIFAGKTSLNTWYQQHTDTQAEAC